MTTISSNPFVIKDEFVIDISGWEKDINWEKLLPRPKGVITKASQYYADPYAVIHSNNMTKYGHVRGLYHFFYENDVAKQVNLFLEVAQKCGAYDGRNWLFEFEPIFDLEWRFISPGKKAAYQVKTWLDAVEDKTGLKSMIYTSQTFWNDEVCWSERDPNGQMRLVAPDWANQYKYWAAWYPELPRPNPIDRYDWPYKTELPFGINEENIVGWQYTASGRMTGIPFDGVDFNAFKKSYMDTITGNRPPTAQAKLSQSIALSNGKTIHLQEQ